MFFLLLCMTWVMFFLELFNVDGVTSYDLSYVLMFILSQTHLLIYYHQLEVRFGQGLRLSLTNIYILKMSMDKFLKFQN